MKVKLYKILEKRFVLRLYAYKDKKLVVLGFVALLVERFSSLIYLLVRNSGRRILQSPFLEKKAIIGLVLFAVEKSGLNITELIIRR